MLERFEEGEFEEWPQQQRVDGPRHAQPEETIGHEPPGPLPCHRVVGQQPRDEEEQPHQEQRPDAHDDDEDGLSHRGDRRLANVLVRPAPEVRVAGHGVSRDDPGDQQRPEVVEVREALRGRWRAALDSLGRRCAAAVTGLWRSSSVHCRCSPESCLDLPGLQPAAPPVLGPGSKVPPRSGGSEDRRPHGSERLANVDTPATPPQSMPQCLDPSPREGADADGNFDLPDPRNRPSRR